MVEQQDYLTLHRIVQGEGLLEKDYKFYIWQIFFIVGLFIAGVVTTNYVLGSLLGVILISVFWAFVQVQIGLIGHDIVHRQVFKSPILSEMGGIMSWNFFLGASSKWWYEQHNAHHNYPNDHHKDPSINLAFFSFSDKQLEQRNKFQRFLIRYQAYLYFPLMAFMVVALRISSIKFILQKRRKLFLVELFSTLLHILLYFIIVWWAFGLWYGFIFAVSHHAFTGLYLGLIFAPNHKGMPMIDSGSLDRFREQVITSRNISGGFFTNFIYGGLNYQIEHHLFPFMSRNKLKSAKPIVEEFCRSRNVSYHETGVLQSFREILGALYRESLAA